ncbi:hypothetical protein [Actinoplanes sp. NPDC051851]|uniref:hypothetical protein n=1 Tax=Actinoplanes sp. NPDC051851 TaxID=3154753 RepID=UPI0034432357
MIGPFRVVIADVASGKLCDPAQLEDLRQTHDLDPAFTLRFADDSTIEVVVGRPGDDGGFTLTALDDNATGDFAETEDVALTTSWLTANGFTHVQSTSSTGGNGSRWFARDDGWEVRYQCVLGVWTLELKPPGATYADFTRLRTRTGEPCWHHELPDLINGFAG